MMNRRDAVVAAGVGLALAGKWAEAQPKSAGAAPAPGKKVEAPAAAKSNAALIAAVDECRNTGADCLQHCIALLSTGDTSMAECTATVRAMLALCDAVAALARQGSPHLKAAAALCAKACRECEAACQKHAGHHAECKACAASCQKCAAECDKA